VSLDTSRGGGTETLVFLAIAALAVVLVITGPTVDDHRIAVLLAAAVVIGGLPHGALDPWIAWRAALWRTWRGAVVFHVVYIAAAASVVVGWLAAPAAGLALFLAVSAWHFAGDWPLPSVLRPLVGTALLAFPAWHWPVEVEHLLTLLGGEGGKTLAGVLGDAGPALTLVALLAAAGLAIRKATLAALELTTLATLGTLLPPLAYFVVYFCFLHSPRHLRQAAAGANAHTRRRLLAVIALYTALALFCFASASPWLADIASPRWDDDLVRIVFIALAALTVPHMCVMALAARRSVRPA